MRLVWIELDVGSDSGATLRIREDGSKPETLGTWPSLVKAERELEDRLIGWYRRHGGRSKAGAYDEVIPRRHPRSSNTYEIPAFGGRE